VHLRRKGEKREIIQKEGDRKQEGQEKAKVNVVDWCYTPSVTRDLHCVSVDRLIA
jgi:hypothetical protein